MTLHTGALSDLDSQRAALLADFAAWTVRTGPGGDLAQHHTQVKRITASLRGALDAALGRTVLASAAARGKASVDDVERPRRAIEVVHLLWDFFRDKLTQRDSKRYLAHLDAADDLAWACYLPFAEARVAAGGVASPEQLKEPPLVFYSSEMRPFAQARASAFHASGLSAQDVSNFRRALAKLPVPLISVPWPQCPRLAPLVFVGHEVGHVVADDLGLEDEARAALARLDVPSARKAVWTRWLDEVFADVFGVVTTGAEYVRQLEHLLAGPVGDVRGEAVSAAAPGAYPTRALRIALCRRVLVELGVDVDRTWVDTYGGPAGDSEAYADDVERIARALLRGPYAALGDKGLADVLPWSAKHETDVATIAKEQLKRARLPGPFSVRLWIAGAARAHREDPASYAASDLDADVAKRIAAARSKGTRSAIADPLRSRVLRGMREPTLAGFDPSALESASGKGGARIEAALDLSALDAARGAELADVLGL